MPTKRNRGHRCRTGGGQVARAANSASKVATQVREAVKSVHTLTKDVGPKIVGNFFGEITWTVNLAPLAARNVTRTETLARKLAKRVQSLRRAATNSARKIAKTGWKVRKKVARLVRRLQRSLKGPNGLPKCLTPKGECTIRKRRFLMETTSNVGCLTSSRGVPRGSSKGPRRVPKGSGTGSCWLLPVRSGSRALSANLFGR